MLLAYDLLERLGAQAISKRRARRRRLRGAGRDFLVGKQVGHVRYRIGRVQENARAGLL